MAADLVRRWAVRPDQVIWTDAYGEIECVSRQAMAEAIMDGESLLARVGGVLEVVTDRRQTGIPGEAVTIGAMVSWKPSPNARPPREQQAPAPMQEQPGQIMVQQPPAPQPSPAPQPDEAMRQEIQRLQQEAVRVEQARPAPPPPAPPEVPVGVGAVTPIGDGLDGMDGVDLSEIPEDKR